MAKSKMSMPMKDDGDGNDKESKQEDMSERDSMHGMTQEECEMCQTVRDSHNTKKSRM